MASLKKITRGKGEQYTYISRQALRYNIVEQLGEPLTPVKGEGSGDKKVMQFKAETTIAEYPELDFFGYLKTQKGSNGKKRSAKVRLSNAISLDTFKNDTDFLTNKGLADRDNESMNLAQAEIHRSYYRYTLTIDLDQIGIDVVDGIELDNTEKNRRVDKLLGTIEYLYRDIRGRREDLKPLFIIGGVYDVKNPIFQNVVNVEEGIIQLNPIKSVLSKRVIDDTICGIVDDEFKNTEEIKNELFAVNIAESLENIRKKVAEYYESN
ncbi:CRISPR-associated protein cas7/cst2/devr, subtype I-b/tneap [Enterococcus saccharolyticus]|nr:CRISPR-associated protein cas7/cst2/devr, subtype I-b/tneap [Enterococcus saccharolyticus]